MFPDKVMGVLQVFYAFLCYLLFIHGTFIYMNCFCTEDICKNVKKKPKKSCKVQDKWFSDAEFKLFLHKVIQKILSTVYTVPCVTRILILNIRAKRTLLNM